MDCDDVALLVAVEEGRTLSGVEEVGFHQHVASCAACQALTGEAADDALRWVARISEDAFDDPDLLVLPTIDPIVFTKGDELARGGMGRITRARDRRLGRDVAVKEVLAPYLRARFEREAMITARLQHPAIVPIYEAGSWPDGSAFYTMRLVSGGTLSDAIAGAHTLEDRLALLPHVVAVTEALGYAHSRRVVHRDLKPANVLVGEFGETVVIDWGLAKELDHPSGEGEGGGEASGAPELTHAGAVVGTPCFLAPEQADGAKIDERVDVYALGAILYNLLAGQPPYWDTTEHSAERLVAASRTSPPTPIAVLAPHAPRDLTAITERAMARDRDARYRTAKEMAEELRRFEAGQLLASREYRVHELVVRWLRRHRAPVAVAAIALAVLAIGGVVSVRAIVVREHQTRRALAESELEIGRQLVVDGAPDRAAPYLAAALAESPDDPITRRLAAIALRDASRRLASFPGTVAAFRADGRELAIGRADGSIDVIDPATAVVLRTLPRLGGAVAGLEYAPDGAMLAVASESGAYLRDARTGAPSVTLSAAPTSELRFLPRGDRVAIVGANAVTVVARDGSLVGQYGPVDAPHALGLAADGARLVALTGDGAIALAVDDLSVVAHVEHAPGRRFAVTLDHDELITAGVDGVRRWSAGGSAVTLVAEPIVTLAWLGEHRLLADLTELRSDTGAARRLARVGVQATAILDRTHVMTGGYDRTLRIWDLERSAQPLVVLDAANATDALVADPTGRRAITRGARDDAQLELWDISKTRAPSRTAAIGTQIDVIFADHRERIVVRGQDGPRAVTTLMTSELAVVAPLDGWPVGFRPGGNEVVTDHDGVLTVYAADSGRAVRDVTGPGSIWHIAFSSTGIHAVTSSERHVSLRDADWRETSGFDTPEGISALAIDDRDRVITGHEDGTLRVWDAGQGRLLATFLGHTTHVSTIELRGDLLVSNSWDGTMRRWAFPSGAALGSFKSFDDVATSPDGQWIATAAGPEGVMLWDSLHGRLLEKIATPDGLSNVAFVDDQHVVAGVGGRLELIDLSEPPRTLDDVVRLVGASTRWRLEGGRLVERW